MKPYSYNSGFIALISMILLGAVLSILIFSTSTSTFFARFNTADRESKRIASSLAESCLELAILYLAQDYSYDPSSDPDFIVGFGVPETIKDGVCYIVSTSPSGPRSGMQTTITIETKGVYNHAISNFEGVVNMHHPTSQIAPTASYITILSVKEKF